MHGHKNSLHGVTVLRSVPNSTVRVVPFTPRGRLPDHHHESNRPIPKFTDSTYLNCVISHLKWVRGDRGVTLQTVARKARVKIGVIRRAEKEGVVPASHDFKAWAAALGFSWEQIWSDALHARSADRQIRFSHS